MVITKAIPASIIIGGFSVSFRYRGQPPTCFVCQEVGHTGRGCPKSRRARKSAENSTNTKNNINNTTRDDKNKSISKPSTQANLTVKSDGKTRVVTTAQPTSKSEEDLRIKINAKKAAKLASNGQVETSAQKPLPLQKETEKVQGQQIEPMEGSNAVEP